MDPFFVLDIDPTATDEEVRNRYEELIRMHPPDRSPETFRIIREAFEAVKTEDARRDVCLFHVGGGDPGVFETAETIVGTHAPPRPEIQFLRFLTDANSHSDQTEEDLPT